MRISVLSLLAVLAGGCPTFELGGQPPPEPQAPAEPAPQIAANRGEVPEPQATLAEVCADDGLALSRFDINTLRHRFASVCCGPDALDPASDRCTAPWPAPEPIPCGLWGKLQAELLARYGNTFADRPALRAHFDAQPWYRPNEDFQTNTMSISAKRNVAALEHFRSQRVDCE